jgi:hypothetical protein
LIRISIPSTRYLLRICFEKRSLAEADSSFAVVAAAARTSRRLSFNQFDMVICSKIGNMNMIGKLD